ncbi:ribonuclease Oy [Pectinophora gossypiella]|uniref:ribonuclease Oy n=1 Tax=Pectinophora gossypiella TaxID=13191 RepID=UPI00214EB17E|nr:ribonuclease Oy [Pectinophora gossypiella]
MWTDSFGFLLFMIVLSSNYAYSVSVKDKYAWDLLIFTQQWPQTVCKEWKQHNPSHKCSLPSNPEIWTIHGVWPTKLHTIGPAYCNRSWHFDPEAVKSIEAPLTQLWTNIEGDTETYALWSHEWTKHGTCAAELEPLNSEFKYFSNGLNWMRKYTMSDILAASKIVPSNEVQYTLVNIYLAVTTKLRVNPAIECRNVDGKSWLVEIRICFNKTLHLTDCDGIKGFKHKSAPYDHETIVTDILTNCDPQQKILYPKDYRPVAPFVIVQLYKLVSWLQWFTL